MFQQDTAQPHTATISADCLVPVEYFPFHLDHKTYLTASDPARFVSDEQTLQIVLGSNRPNSTNGKSLAENSAG